MPSMPPVRSTAREVNPGPPIAKLDEERPKLRVLRSGHEQGLHAVDLVVVGPAHRVAVELCREFAQEYVEQNLGGSESFAAAVTQGARTTLDRLKAAAEAS